MKVVPSFTNSTQGFNLVEVALAMLVVAVGVLTVIGLFPVGLEQSTSARYNTYDAVLAEQVFARLRAVAAVNWAGLLTAEVELSGDDLNNGLVLTNSEAASRVNIKIVNNPLDPDPEKNKAQIVNVENGNLSEHEFSYLLFVTNNLCWTNVVDVKFLIWDARYGSPASVPKIYFTEIYKINP